MINAATNKMKTEQEIPAQQTFILMKMSWRRLEDVFRLRFQKTYSRCLQDVLIKTNIFVLVIGLQDIVKTSLRCLQEVLRKSLQDIFKTSCKNVFKKSSRCFEDVLKMSSTYLQDIFKMSCKDVFKTFLVCIIKLICSC